MVEIKVSRADLHGDGKWPDYCDWCDRIYWALAPGLDPAILENPDYRPESSGLIIAERYGAAVVREAASCNLAPARRRSEEHTSELQSPMRTSYGVFCLKKKKKTKYKVAATTTKDTQQIPKT